MPKLGLSQPSPPCDSFPPIFVWLAWARLRFDSTGWVNHAQENRNLHKNLGAHMRPINQTMTFKNTASLCNLDWRKSMNVWSDR